MLTARISAPQQHVYAWADIATHNTPADCWVVVHGQVFDVTRFLSTHPGGVGALSKAGRGGCDVTQHFERIGHSQHARDILQTLSVGVVAAEREHAIRETTRRVSINPCSQQGTAQHTPGSCCRRAPSVRPHDQRPLAYVVRPHEQRPLAYVVRALGFLLYTRTTSWQWVVDTVPSFLQSHAMQGACRRDPAATPAASAPLATRSCLCPPSCCRTAHMCRLYQRVQCCPYPAIKEYMETAFVVGRAGAVVAFGAACAHARPADARN